MRRTVLTAFVVSLFLLAQACGGEDGGVSKQEANQVFAAASAAAAQVQGDVFAGMAQRPGKADAVTVGNFTYEWTESSFSFTGTVNGAEGGTVTVSGTGTWDEGAQTAEFSFDMVFDGFSSQGIILDGTLSMHFKGSQGSYEMTYKGNIESSGKVVGSVTFDLTVKITEGKVEYAGTVGGHSFSGSASYNVPSY